MLFNVYIYNDFSFQKQVFDGFSLPDRVDKGRPMVGVGIMVKNSAWGFWRFFK